MTIDHAQIGAVRRAAGTVVVVEPSHGWRALDLKEFWNYRQLLYFLMWRDVKVRYKQAVLGVAWAVLQPFLTMVVFSVFLGRLAGGTVTTGLPYPIFVFAGLLPWMFFAGSVGGAGMSILGNERLITKIYFPRLLVPVAAVGVGLVDLAVSLGMLAAMMMYYGVAPSLGVVILPVAVGGLILTAVGVGTLLAALSVAYRDFRYVIPFLIQIWMFATPSVYLQTDRALNPRLRALLFLNPADGFIANFRAAALGGRIDPYSLASSLALAAGICAIGILYFRRVERGFADII
jgi:lipopolysaccharide transport system permease protein